MAARRPQPVLEFRFVCGNCGGESLYMRTCTRYANVAAVRDGWGTDPMDRSVTLCPACMGKIGDAYEED